MMVKTSGSWLPEHPSPWESYGFLPATTDLCNTSNLGLNVSGFSGFPRGGLAYEANDLIRKPAFCSRVPPLTPSEYFSEQNSLFQARVDVITSTDGVSSTPEKNFLIFDQSGNETRLIHSTSLFPQNAAQTRYSPRSQLVAEDQPSKRELVCNEKYVILEESGENETVDEGSEMREDTEEINALLYSDDDDFDDESEDDDEASTGHSPSVNREYDFEEVASFDRSTKRQKTLDDGHNKPPILSATTIENGNPSNATIDSGGESVCSSNEESSPTIGNKRVRKDKIRDTLRVLESTVPGLKSRDPIIILEEAINYLKSLKSNAKTMSMEDPDGSSCIGPSN